MTRELDSRVSDGIHVRLLWHACDGQVSVTVDDAKTGAAFEILVPEGARALDVFHHPYAYAALPRQQSESSFNSSDVNSRRVDGRDEPLGLWPLDADAHPR
jgi:hypothetical protein